MPQIASKTNIARGWDQNFIVVGRAGDFNQISDALDYISDSSADNQYLISVMPGTYDPFSLGLKTGITIRGSGRGTIVECDNTINGFINCKSVSCALERFHVERSDSGSSPGANRPAISRDGGMTDFVMKDISVNFAVHANTTATNYAVDFLSLSDPGMKVHNLRIETEGSGISLPSGNNDYFNTLIQLTGNNANADRYGIMQAGSGRNYFWGGRITTGYGVAQPTANSIDIILVYIPAANTETSGRIHLYDVTGFAVNKGDPVGDLYCIKAENGWVRVFGGLFQAENQNTTPSYTAKAIYAALGTGAEPGSGNKGQVELYGVRHSGCEGGVSGDTSVPVRRISAAATISKYEGGVFECDLSGGAFTITLTNDGNSNNEDMVFINTHASNTLTIAPTGVGLIDGVNSSITVGPRSSTRLIKTGTSSHWTV